MKHSIKKTDDGLRIEASVAAEKQTQLLDEFAKCAAGTCSCPTPQYAKVSSMNVIAEATGVKVDLKVKPGESIDISEVEKCLEHTARQIGG